MTKYRIDVKESYVTNRAITHCRICDYVTDMYTAYCVKQPICSIMAPIRKDATVYPDDKPEWCPLKEV